MRARVAWLHQPYRRTAGGMALVCPAPEPGEPGPVLRLEPITVMLPAIGLPPSVQARHRLAPLPSRPSSPARADPQKPIWHGLET